MSALFPLVLTIIAAAGLFVAAGIIKLAIWHRDQQDRQALADFRAQCIVAAEMQRISDARQSSEHA
ncbi:hypothetical protein [Pseudoxanthomonas putridarboris]|uniref:Uncharacterized protein n=1 Tax=Pseudoxanthomonas putridarboris TaxID=752605 RepID=A0ABU9IZM0_9GAMM